eukprot:scaffold501999_cov33-Prasinocladus_malaysianus.AAC.1
MMTYVHLKEIIVGQKRIFATVRRETIRDTAYGPIHLICSEQGLLRLSANKRSLGFTVSVKPVGLLQLFSQCLWASLLEPSWLVSFMVMTVIAAAFMIYCL